MRSDNGFHERCEQHINSTQPDTKSGCNQVSPFFSGHACYSRNFRWPAGNTAGIRRIIGSGRASRALVVRDARLVTRIKNARAVGRSSRVRYSALISWFFLLYHEIRKKQCVRNTRVFFNIVISVLKLQKFIALARTVLHNNRAYPSHLRFSGKVNPWQLFAS